MTSDNSLASDNSPISELAKDNLRDGQSLFLSLVHNIPACFVRKDRKGEIVFANKRFAKLMGTNAEDMIGKTLADFYPEEFAQAAREEDEKVMLSGEVREDVFDDTVDGELHYFASRKGPVYNEQGKVIGIQTIFWDITKQRLAEQALEAEREELRIAKEAADAANRAKSDFLANMSHEIRTPMNAIIGMTDLLLETQLTSSQREYLSMVQDSGEALMTLINDILDFSKIEAGKLELECVPFDIRDSLGDAMKGLGFRAHSKGLELACHIDEKIPQFLFGDPGRIRQIIVNLVGNAIKFTSKGEVVLEIERMESDTDHVKLHFAVIDTGIGIAKENLGRIFSEFEQADTSTTRQFGGTGLGLAISSRLIQLMNGRIWVESDLGVGSKFQFEMDLEIPDADSVLPQLKEKINIQDIRVLIVDDNATNRRILKNMLTNWGMNPTTTSNGSHALQAIKDANEEEDAFELLISDVNMPEMDGLMLATKIVEKSMLDPNAIIMLTSGARPSDSADLQALGINLHLLKPAKQSELYDAIISSLGATGHAKAGSENVSAKQRQESPSISNLEILLAEDNVVNQKLAVGILDKLGHNITIANNGREALDSIDRHEFDLVLMDVQMPELDGLAATRELRQREKKSGLHLPVIAMTAHAMKGDREKCLDAGMDEYLTKPIRMQDIADLLDEMINHGELTPSEKRTYRDSPENASELICWEDALNNTGGDNDLLKELLQIFLDDAPRLLKNAFEAADHQDASLLRTAVHSLKGSMLFLNPQDAIQCAQHVEQLAESNDIESAKLGLKDMQRHLDPLVKELHHYLES